METLHILMLIFTNLNCSRVYLLHISGSNSLFRQTVPNQKHLTLLLEIDRVHFRLVRYAQLDLRH